VVREQHDGAFLRESDVTLGWFAIDGFQNIALLKVSNFAVSRFDPEPPLPNAYESKCGRVVKDSFFQLL